jgi:hypothetical protein
VSDAGDQALALWRRWFDESGGYPCAEDGFGGTYCVFCDGIDNMHEANCVWVMAKELIGRGQNETMGHVDQHQSRQG